MSREAQITKAAVAKFRDVCEIVYENTALAMYSRWRIGGEARCVVMPSSVDEVAAVVRLCRSQSIPYVVVGSSSNLLFADEGLDAVLIHIGEQLSSCTINECTVISQSGVWVPHFAQKVARAGLTGAEHMAGIPGTLGGLICMNGGSQRKGVGEQVVRVTSVSPTGEIQITAKEDCHFAYRTSIFQNTASIVVEAELEYSFAENKQDVLARMRNILRERRLKFPLKQPNCGSVFVSNPAMYRDYGPPGAIIEKLGLKGLRRGGAGVSKVHANFVVNYGSALAEDILWLIYHIQSTVAKNTGYTMPAEVRYVAVDGTIVPAHEKAVQLWS